MIEKTFKIMSNSEEYLTESIIAQALLEHVTLNADQPQVFFAVVDYSNKEDRLNVNNFA